VSRSQRLCDFSQALSSPEHVGRPQTSLSDFDPEPIFGNSAHTTGHDVVSTVTITSEDVSAAQHPESVESQQRFSQGSSVVHCQGSSSLVS
jgi:hypothetical protein